MSILDTGALSLWSVLVSALPSETMAAHGCRGMRLGTVCWFVPSLQYLSMRLVPVRLSGNTQWGLFFTCINQSVMVPFS